MEFTQDEIKRQREKYWFNVASTFFLVVQLIILSALVFDPQMRPFLVWMCNNFCFFLAIACYLQNMQLVKGISYLGLIAQLLWAADFVSPFLGFNVSSITDYIFIQGYTYANVVSIALHLFIPLIVVALSFRIRPTIKSLLYTVPYIIILFIATLLLTQVGEDTNCVFTGCNLSIYFPFHVPYHSWMWPFFALIPAFLGYLIHKGLYYGWHNLLKGKVHLKI